MTTPLLLGVDLGTSGVDACAFTLDGRLVAASASPLETRYPQPGWAEQEAASWTTATLAALRDLAVLLGPTVGDVAAIGLTGACPSFALVRDDGTPVTSGLIYQDNRATEEAMLLTRRLGGAQVRARSGMEGSHFLVAPKALWLGAHLPDLREERPWLAQPRDLAVWYLTGRQATDPTHAGCTGLFDLHTGDWAWDWQEELDLTWLRLPQICAPTTCVGGLTASVAARVGLRSGLPVVIGAADNFCADLAMGAVLPGFLGDSSGTATCLDLTVSRHFDAAGLSLYRHFTHGMLFATVGLNATGATIAWAARVLAGGSVAELEALADAAPPAADAPLLLPYLGAGERTDAGATGIWHGLTLAHDPARLARSVYEGITFALNELVEQFRAAGLPIAEARVAGGGSRSALWNRLKADVWGVSVRAAAVADASAQGAALLAGIGVGLYRDLDAAVACLPQPGLEFVPDLTRQALYQDLYARWQSIKAQQEAAS